MWNAQHSMATILVAAEAGSPLTVTESEMRERLSTLVDEVTMARGWSMNQKGEYDMLCRALDRVAEAR